MSYAVDVCSGVAMPREDVPEVDEVDDGTIHHQPLPPVNQLLQQFDLMSLLTSPRREIAPALAPVVVRARFSFIENRYGTRSAAPKKASKQTVDRLANPIHGFTSTLNALPPDVRKRRQQVELSLASHHTPAPSQPPPDRKVVPKKHQATIVDRLSKPTFIRPKLKLRPDRVALPPLPKATARPSKPASKPSKNQSSDKPPSRPAATKKPKPPPEDKSCKNDSGGGFFLTQMDDVQLPRRGKAGKSSRAPPAASKQSRLKSNKVVPARPTPPPGKASSHRIPRKA